MWSVLRGWRLGSTLPLAIGRRNTWVLKHALPLGATPPGRLQRPPWEKQIYQCYEVVQTPDDVQLPPVTVILLQDVEGIGRAMDVLDVPSDVAHNQLFLSKKAVYASPFNRRLYGIDPLSKTASRQLSFEHRTSRALHSRIVILHMTLDSPWQLSKWHLVVSLRRMGFVVPERCVLLPEQPVLGPNLDLEAKLFRFYVLINGRIVVPMLARLQQVSSVRAAKRIVVGGLDPHRTNDDELRTCQISPEDVYESDESLLALSDDQIRRLMQTRRRK